MMSIYVLKVGDRNIKKYNLVLAAMVFTLATGEAVASYCSSSEQCVKLMSSLTTGIPGIKKEIADIAATSGCKSGGECNFTIANQLLDQLVITKKAGFA